MKYLPISADIRSSNQITIFTFLFQNTFQNTLEKPEIMQEEDKEMAIAVSEPTDTLYENLLGASMYVRRYVCKCLYGREVEFS